METETLIVLATFHLDSEKYDCIVDYEEKSRKGVDDQGNKIRYTEYVFTKIGDWSLLGTLHNQLGKTQFVRQFTSFDITIHALDTVLRGCTVVKKTDTGVSVKATSTSRLQDAKDYWR